MKRPSGSKHSIHYLTPSMKKISKSVGRHNSRSITRQVTNQCIFGVLGKLIRKDMEHLCSTKTPSMLRKRMVEAMKSFCWDDFMKELESDILPNFERLCVQKKEESIKTWQVICCQ